MMVMTISMMMINYIDDDGDVEDDEKQKVMTWENDNEHWKGKKIRCQFHGLNPLCALRMWQRQ